MIREVDGRTYDLADDMSVEIIDEAIGFLQTHASELMDVKVSISLLQGGASNVNLRVTTGAACYALRLCDKDAARWGVDRAAAIQAQTDAAAVGLAPRIVADTLPDGDFLSEFVDGQ